jgi:epoxyqueuosine reductase
MDSLETRLKEQARRVGFEAVGIAPAAEADGFAHLRAWLDQGYAGDMGYLHRHAEARRHPSSVLPEVKSVVMTALNYKPACDPTPPAKVARYALGRDYHDVLRERQKALLAWLQDEVPGCRGRAVVDTAPLLERDFARRAGLGWVGKNTMLIDKRLGSYFFLGALLVDVELAADPPHGAAHCGTCTRCLDACPTAAFPSPGVLDARRCLSYLTIELKGPVEEYLRPAMTEWLFGCDICQEVCPWNRKAPTGVEPDFAPREELLTLEPAELLGIDEAEFRRRFGHTALARAGRAGLLRNAALLLGNRGGAGALVALERACRDVDPLVREAAAWAVGRLGADRDEHAGVLAPLVS